MLYCQQVQPGVAAALSVGSDPRSPSLAHKGRRDVPNEDGLLVLSQDDWLLLAVADGHHGPDASHTLLKRLFESSSVPTSAGQLGLFLLDLAHPPWPGLSGTTFLVAGLNLATGQGFGFSWGDSFGCVLGGAHPRMLFQTDTNFLRSGQPLEVERAASFRFTLEANEALVVGTDGVTECHYRSPLTSVTLQHMNEFMKHSPSAKELAWQIGHLALEGVGGHPGGQDNLALLVARR